MKLGITYDTAEMYSNSNKDNLHSDFASLLAISQLKSEFEKLDCQVELIGGLNELNERLKRGTCQYDIIYNTAEGINSRNREGLIPSLLEANNIPYMGTDSFGLSLSLNKVITKILANHLGILTPRYCFFRSYHDMEDAEAKLECLNLPIIVKPNYEGNSSGICICKTYIEAKGAVERLLEQYKTEILCEEFIFGKEITVPVIGNDPNSFLWGITTVDIQTDDSFWLDVNQKVFGDYKNIMLNLPDKINDRFKDIIIKLFNAIGCQDFARFDFRLSKDNNIYFIEANPLPCLFIGGSFDVVGQQNGYSYAETLNHLLNTSCTRLSIPRI